MSRLELSFASKEDSLSVRRFAIREAMSDLFEVSVVARSPNDDIDLESIVGQPASLRITSGIAHARHRERCWSGCAAGWSRSRPRDRAVDLSSLHRADPVAPEPAS